MTQYQKIVKLMCRYSNDWFLVSDFMGKELGDFFVGYKAAARINELENDYPGIFLKRQNGRFVERKINKDDIDDWFPNLTKDLRQIVARELNHYPRPLDD